MCQSQVAQVLHEGNAAEEVLMTGETKTLMEEEEKEEKEEIEEKEEVEGEKIRRRMRPR